MKVTWNFSLLIHLVINNEKEGRWDSMKFSLSWSIKSNLYNWQFLKGGSLIDEWDEVIILQLKLEGDSFFIPAVRRAVICLEHYFTNYFQNQIMYQVMGKDEAVISVSLVQSQTAAPVIHMP